MGPFVDAPEDTAWLSAKAKAASDDEFRWGTAEAAFRPSSSREKEHGMTREHIVALFERRQQAMNQHDVAALSDMFSEDAVVESPMAGGTIRGRRRNEEVSQALFNGFPDIVFSAEDLVIDGNRAVWITETHGTDTGGFLGLPPTGKPFRLPVVWVCTLDGGRIVHERRIYDFTGMLMQIGVLKAKPA